MGKLKCDTPGSVRIVEEKTGYIGEVEYRQSPYIPGQFGRVRWYDVCDRGHYHYFGSNPLDARSANEIARKIESGELRFDP
jgi:hypothetical protein